MAKRTKVTTYVWTDRAERAYATLRSSGGHWRLEWGYRDPPESDHYAQQGEHVTSVEEEAVQWMLEQIHALSDDPKESALVEPKLRQAIHALQG